MAHLADGIRIDGDKLEPRETASQIVQTLTDIAFIEMRAVRDEVPELLADYNRAMNLRPTLNEAQSIAGTGAPPVERWRREVVAEVIDGKTTRHSERGAGPIVFALRKHARAVRGFGVVLEQLPLFLEGEDAPENWFPETVFRHYGEVTKSGLQTRLNGSDKTLREFAAFVSATSHWLSAPGADIPGLAFNFRDSGSVAEAAAGALQIRRKPWLRRHNRPAFSSGSTALIRTLPVDVPHCVIPDLSRFVTMFGQSPLKGPASVEARVFSMSTGAELQKLNGAAVSMGTWHSPIASSLGGDRVILGSVVADFANRDVYSLQETETIRAVALTPDGRMAALVVSAYQSQERKGFIRIWDLDVRQRVRDFDDEDPEIHSVAISADGRILAAARHCEDFRIWDVAHGECLLTLFLAEHVRAAAITPDGRFAACGGDSGDIWLVDLAAPCVLRRLAGNHRRICAVALTPDGRFVAAFDSDWLLVWDVKTGCSTATIPVPANPSCQLLLSTDASMAVVGAHVINLRSASKLGIEPRPIAAAITQDGRTVAFAREDGCLSVAGFGEMEARVIFRRCDFDPAYTESPYTPVGIGLDQDGQRAVFAFWDGGLYGIDLATGGANEIIPRAELERLVAEELPKVETDAAHLRGEDRLPPNIRAGLSARERPFYSFSHIVCSPDGRFVTTAYHGDALRVWNIETGECFHHLPMRRRSSFDEGELRCLKSLPDSSGVVFTTTDGALYCWRFRDVEKITIRAAPTVGSLNAQAAIAPCGKRVIWVANWKPMEIRDLTNGKLLATFPQRLGFGYANIQFVEWCSEHAIAIVVDNDPYGVSLEVWDSRCFERVAQYPVSGRVNVLVVSPSSKRLLCCTEDGQSHALSLEEEPFKL